MAAVGKTVASFLFVCGGILLANFCGFLIELVFLVITPWDMLAGDTFGGTVLGFVEGVFACVFAASWIEAVFGEDFARTIVAWVTAVPLLLIAMLCFYVIQDNGGRELLDWGWIGWITEFATCAGMGLLMRTIFWDEKIKGRNAGVV